MTDERQGDGLLGARRAPAARAPASSFAITASAGERAARLFDGSREAAPGPVLLAGPAELALAWGADGSHGRHAARPASAPAHDLRGA